MAKAGRKPVRPSTPEDFDELEKLMAFYPSREELANWFECSTQSLDRKIKSHFKCNFEQLRDKRFTKTRIAIKRKQIEVALKGNPTMLIWCGKIMLGQSDTSDADAGDQMSNVREIKLAYSVDKKTAEAK